MPTKSLSANSQKSLAQKEQFVTTKELATVLGVTVRTVNETISKLNKDLESTFQVTVKNGVATKLNEEQATLIKNEIKKHHNLKQNSLVASGVVANRQIDNVSTTVEEDAIVLKAVAILQNRINSQQQKIDSLQIELDQSKEWYSIKRMEMLNPDKTFNWRTLKAESEKMGIERKDVFDANYGEVKAYHKSVWESLYFDSINYGD